MRVRLLTDLSFADGLKPVGDVVEITDPQAEVLLSLGLIEKAEAKSKPEAAALADPPEHATVPHGRKRGG